MFCGGMKGEAQHVCNPDRPSVIFLPSRVYHRGHNRGCEPAQLMDLHNKLIGWRPCTAPVDTERGRDRLDKLKLDSVCSCRQAAFRPSGSHARSCSHLGGKIFARRIPRLVQLDVTKYRRPEVVGQKFPCFTSWNPPPKLTIGNSWNPTHGSALDMGADEGMAPAAITPSVARGFNVRTLAFQFEAGVSCTYKGGIGSITIR